MFALSVEVSLKLQMAPFQASSRGGKGENSFLCLAIAVDLILIVAYVPRSVTFCPITAYSHVFTFLFKMYSMVGCCKLPAMI